MYLFKYYIIVILFAIAMLFNKSKNKKMRTIGLVISILSIIIYGFVYLDTSVIFNPIFVAFYIVFLFGIFLMIYIKYRNMKYQKESYEDINYLNRDVSADYSPPIVGYLVKHRLRYKDLIADIMELYAKKIINISKSNEQGEKKIHFYLIDEDYKNKVKSQSQLYIIKTLINDTQNIDFNFATWKQLVLEEYEERKFAKEKNDSNLKKVVLIIIICMVLIGGILGGISGISANSYGFPIFIGIMLGAFLGTIVGYLYITFMKSSENTNVFLSKYGENELKKWIKFKKFIEDYTLLKDRSIEETTIYESYIPYAIVLDVNVQYKDTKFDIFDENEFESIINESDSANFLQSMGITI